MKSVFLIVALALPALPWSEDKIFDELVKLVEKDDPSHTVVLIHKDIPLLNPDAVYTPLVFRDKWRVWIKGAA